MKKSISFISAALLIAFFCNSLQGQDYKFHPKNYDFDDAALTSPMMDSTGFHMSYHWLKIYTELTEAPDPGPGKYRLTHELRQINDIRAVEEFNKIYLPIYGQQQLVKVKARVIKDGKVLYTATEKDIRSVEEDDVEYKILALESVTPGCYIESILSIVSNISLSGSEPIQPYSPVRDLLTCVITPNHVILDTKVYNTSDSVSVIENDERYFYTVKRQNPVHFQREEYCFNDAHRGRMDYILGEITGTSIVGSKWSDIGQLYFNNCFENYDKSKSGLKKVLKELKIADMKDDLDKIFAIENHLKSNVQVDGYLPTEQDASAILKSHQSSPFGYNRLMMFLFREAGISFELVGTCSREDRYFDKDFVSEDFFTDALFYFPGSDVYLEPQDPTVRIPIIGFEHYGQDAIRIKLVEIGGDMSPVVTIKKIPLNKIDEHVISENYEVSFAAENSKTQVKYRKEYSGNADQGIRAICYFTDEEQRKEILDQIVKGEQENAKLSNVQALNTDLSKRTEYDQPLVITADVEGSDLLEFAGDKVIFKIGDVIGKQSELYEEKPRQNPVDIEFAHVYRRTITVNIPDGYTLKGTDALTKDLKAELNGQKLAFFTSNFKQEGNQLTVTIEESYNEIKYPLSLYNDFSAVINAAADFNKVTLVLEKI